jgi:hypothetical protein
VVPELTRSSGIQLNERVSLRRAAKAASVSCTGYVPHRTQQGNAAGRLYSALRLCRLRAESCQKNDMARCNRYHSDHCLFFCEPSSRPAPKSNGTTSAALDAFPLLRSRSGLSCRRRRRIGAAALPARNGAGCIISGPGDQKGPATALMHPRARYGTVVAICA